MSKPANTSIKGITIVVVLIIIGFANGAFAWQWINPKNFFGALLFLMVWSTSIFFSQLLLALTIVGIETIIQKRR